MPKYLKNKKRFANHGSVPIFLDEEDLTLMTELQNIWRMSTTYEIMGSLVCCEENAGCIWNGRSGNYKCQVQPNKDACTQ